MTSRIMYNIALAALVSIGIGMAACSDSEDCADSEGAPCDPTFDLEDCTCGVTSTTETSDDALTDEEAQEGKYRYVLVEDLTDPVGGDAPGADLDAVSVTTTDGVEHYARTVEDFNIGQGNNSYINPSFVLGPRDSGCEKQNFVSLGGARSDGYVMLGFSSAAEEVTFGKGSRVTVYELGKTTCPNQRTWDDDPYSVSVSVSNDRSSFIEIGTGGPGTNVIYIP